jgi:HEPN domain-containing protein
MSDQQVPEVVQEWLKHARSDLHLSQAALVTSGVMPEDACFHAQQCAEKALKALLIYLGVDYPRTHVLEVLLDLLKEQSVQIHANMDLADELTQYAVETRYPGEWEPVSKEEAQGATERAAFVLHGWKVKSDKLCSVKIALKLQIC